MKLIFAGTPEFAACALQALLDTEHEIALVLTQPDRPAGRGMKLRPSAVKALALSHGLRVEQPVSLKSDSAQAMLGEVQADAMIVAAYGLLLPSAVLALPKWGCLNIHASLLPRWRGAAPIQRAILAGDAVTGVTIMQMDEGLDTGAMLLARETPIDSDDTAASVHDRLAALGAEAIVEVLSQLPHMTAHPQPTMGVTYAAKLTKAEAKIDWSQPAEHIARCIQAYHPVPVASTVLDGQGLKVWRARVVSESGAAFAEAGEIVQVSEERCVVACGTGAVELLEVQLAGGRRLSIAEFLRGRSGILGRRLGDA